MPKGRKSGVGYGNPPRESRFKPGKSGNLKGRPKGSKNFATVIARELDDRVPVTENGRRKKISKREAIAKQVINKAASGDLKAVQTVLAQARFHEEAPHATDHAAVFDKPSHRLVMAEIIRRIRLPIDDKAPAPSEDTLNADDGIIAEPREDAQ